MGLEMKTRNATSNKGLMHLLRSSVTLALEVDLDPGHDTSSQCATS